MCKCILEICLDDRMRRGRPDMRSKGRKRILAFAAALAVCTGTVFGGLTSGADQVYADSDKRSDIQQGSAGIPVKMVDSVDELDEAMDAAGMVKLEDVEDYGGAAETGGGSAEDGDTSNDVRSQSADANAAETSGGASDDIEEEKCIGQADGGRYSLRRIVLFADEVSDDYGASDIICYDKYDYYILGFDTEQDTEQAYRQMVADYGSGKCMLDEIMYADDVLADEGDFGTAQNGAGERAEMDESSAFTEDTADISSSTSPYTAVSWGTEYMGMDTLKASVSSYSVEATVDVAVIDTGVNDSNSLFDGRIDKTASRNCYDSDNTGDYSDSLGHGSHVAGIIADATPDNVQLTIIKCFSDSGTTSGTIIQKGIMAALDQDVDVINMSVCFYGDNAKEETKVTIDGFIAAAKERSIVMCVAAGNAGRNGSPMDVEGNSYPADREDVITVSALQKRTAVSGGTEDAGDTTVKVDNTTVEFASGYSYYGDKVDFSAPGSAVRSAWKDGGYRSDTGTSMASPHIAAAAAYVKMAEPGLTNDELKARLIEYSVDLGDTGKDIYCGYGCPYMADYFRNVYDDGSDIIPGKCAVTRADNTSSGIKVSWDQAENADGYRVYRKEVGVGYHCIAVINGGTFTYEDNAVQPGTYYRYAVKASRGEKLGQCAGTFLTIRLATPNVAAKNVKGGIKVAWSKTAGAQGYRIYRKKKGTSSWSVYKSVKAGTCSLVDTEVSPNTTYIYTVKAYHSYVWSSYKAGGASAYRVPDAAFASVRSDTGRTVYVKWKKISGVTGYQLQRSYDASFGEYRAVTLAGSVTDRTMRYLTSGKTCYVRIRCYKKTGGKVYYGAWSTAKKIKVR